MAAFNPLPNAYWAFFVIVEPLLTVIGAYMIIFDSETTIRQLLPHKTSSIGPVHAETFMLARQIGSCFGILASMSAIVLPMLNSRIKDKHVLHDILIRYFGILAVFDLVHIGLTLVELDRAGVLTLEALPSWTQLVHGNTTLVVGLFVWRSAWYLSTSAARKRSLKQK